MQVREEDWQKGKERGRQLAKGETETNRGEYRQDNVRPITHSQQQELVNSNM